MYTLENKPWGPKTQGPDEVETTSMEVHHASVVHFVVGAISVLPDGEWERDRVNIRDPRARVLGEEPNRRLDFAFTCVRLHSERYHESGGGGQCGRGEKEKGFVTNGGDRLE